MKWYTPKEIAKIYNIPVEVVCSAIEKNDLMACKFDDQIPYTTDQEFERWSNDILYRSNRKMRKQAHLQTDNDRYYADLRKEVKELAKISNNIQE